MYSIKPSKRRPKCWTGKRDCEECEGRGTVVTGMASEFNVRNMELVDVDLWGPCKCAEYLDPDEFDDFDRFSKT